MSTKNKEHSYYIDGVFNLVFGKAEEIADEMISNPDCRKITFTGSTPVGKSLMRKAGDYIKPLSLELGGNAPLLIFDDADLENAVEGAIAAKFRNSGQSCIAANRIFVQDDIAEEFTEAFVDATNQLKVGPGIDGGMDIGALMNQSALDGALAYIHEAVQNGATLVCGGTQITKNNMDKGLFFKPAVLTNVIDDMDCMNEEIFAPVAPITTFSTFDEGIRRANATEYGLSAYVFTSNMSQALRAGEELEAGTIGINDGVPSTSNCPFGGMKQSGIG